ncbi:hypothetical protein A2704_03590 [Candidatus Kaiserbacteria bacterium RIFCSPHIGHO2_01_FULL_54_36b]|uniref:BIG2 domain-containing protein n=1 Tax=Candidatus Kaiserbacteria bacterium RIFCSPHIGHO2_01_FULL_54_36b TaxID=1798483 RepID=A0A1F6CHQ4_9BACT|nr:MAG: hypothetical protein A2704_03590 [Candidatus Kaiserbacteria bacterium RIFCSPHIGHO2_01_FULL_54_36b]
MTVRYQLLFSIVALCATLAFATAAHAQFGLSGSDSALSITFSPTTPSAGDTVRLTVQSPLFEMPESIIVWRANGAVIAEGRGVDSASVEVGAVGTETRISVTVTQADGASASTQATIIPAELDLLVDSDSYTPPFYRGRPQAGAGTNIRLQAVPRFRRAGTTFPASELVYTWRRNGEILGSFSGRGKSTAILPMAHLFGTDTISVEARSADGAISHTTSLSFSAAEPILTLYEDHPLYGILFHRALGASTFIPETEMTFAAVPFFAQALHAYDPRLNFAWRVNTAEIPTKRTEPNKLTINAENSSGVAFIELGITHATNYYLDAKGAWNVTFSSGAGGGTDLFRTNQ